MILHRENSDVLIWVEKVLKNVFIWLNQVESALFTLYISTSKLLVQSVVYTYQKVDK